MPDPTAGTPRQTDRSEAVAALSKEDALTTLDDVIAVVAEKAMPFTLAELRAVRATLAALRPETPAPSAPAEEAGLRAFIAALDEEFGTDLDQAYPAADVRRLARAALRGTGAEPPIIRAVRRTASVDGADITSEEAVMHGTFDASLWES